jgi:hypothetical protein
MKIKRAEDNLILQDSAIALWIFGLFFVFVGSIFVYGSLGGFENSDEVPSYAIYLAFSMGAIAVGVGIWQIYIHPFSQISINKQTREIVSTQKGLFGKREKVYHFDEVAEFCVVESEDDESNPIWRTALKLKDGKIIEISKIWEHRRENSENASEKANNFIRFN